MAGRRTYCTRAIVLDRTKLAEQDLILTLLSADGSQARAVAKGARKPGGRLAARAELFCETDFLLAAGRSLDVVSEAQTVEPHARLRGDYERVAAASAVAEVARLTCFEQAPDGFLYPICSRALTACEQAADRAHLDLAVAAYVWKVLAHGGWRPELGGCCACGGCRRLVLLGSRRRRALRELRARGRGRPGGGSRPALLAPRASGQHLRRASRRACGHRDRALPPWPRPRVGRHTPRRPSSRDGVLPRRVKRGFYRSLPVVWVHRFSRAWVTERKTAGNRVGVGLDARSGCLR